MRKLVYALSFAALLAGGSILVSAQGPQNTPGWIHIPDSTKELLSDHGKFAHTNHLIWMKGGQPAGTKPTGRTPLDMWQVYVDPNATGYPARFGVGTIAIVDAYDYGTALHDFNAFAIQFGLPQETSSKPTASTNQVFQVVYATTNGKAPRSNCGWAQEAALDIEWAHAMAPNAKIVLVEAASSSFSDLFSAVDAATKIVKGAGGGPVSMSWGGSEFSGEASNDSHFNNSSVIYYASSGDTGGVTIYPSVSPYVVAAGGTTLTGYGTSATETGWSGSGGGPSKYEKPAPGYQLSVISPLTGQLLTVRGVPDVSFDADPYTGVSVYDTTPCQGMSGWMVFGGTSVSAPSLAGLSNSAVIAAGGSSGLLYSIYSGGANYFDVSSGTAGKYSAVKGWDFVTGVGTPRGLSGM